MRNILVSFVALAATGCVIEHNSDPHPDGSISEPVIPRAGSWYYAEITPVSNTCGAQIGQAENGSFAIDQTSATGFRVLPQDGSDPFLCSLSGSAFNCPDRAAGSRDLGTIDATVYYRATAHGTFSNPIRATGSQQATVTCMGTQCNALGVTFPCNFSVNYVIAGA